MQITSTSDYIYNDLKNKITRMTYLPGDNLNELMLADIYDTSRTTVKKALVKLDAENLVFVKPQIGTYVAKIDLTNIIQLLSVRHALEYSIFDRVVKNITEADKKKLDDNLEKQKIYLEKDFTLENSLKLWDLDNEFHKILFDVANQPLLWLHIEQELYQLNRYRILSNSIGANDNLSKTVSAHKEILSAIENQQEDIYDLYYRHIFGNFFTVTKDLKKQYPHYFVEE